MFFKKIVTTNYYTNCYIFGDETTKEVAIIDPGGDFDKINEIIENDNLTVKYIIATHGHFDHIIDLDATKKKYNALVAVHKLDAPFLYDCSSINYNLYFEVELPQVISDVLLNDEDVLSLGKYKLKIIHTPGHTPGGISIYIEDEKILFSGDSLFKESIGRTDFPYGNYDLLVSSIKKLYKLPDQTTVYSGHGFKTTIGIEKKSNPYVVE